MKKNKSFLWLIVIAIIIVVLCAFLCFRQDKGELKSIKSKAELMRIYNGNGYEDNIFIRFLTMPFSLIYGLETKARYNVNYEVIDDVKTATSEATSLDNMQTSSTTGTQSKDYSTTNIQVENVDEADITKTDGNYIYSISGNEVIITDVRDESNIKIASRISINEDDYIPDDLILYGNKLVVISTYYMYYSNSNTMVSIYDVTNKQDPRISEEFKLYEQYYTSRCIDGKLLIVASGVLRKENNEIATYYEENNVKKDIELSNIKYLKDLKSINQTLIASYNLNKQENVKIKSYLFDVENAYISQENMYLLENRYNGRDNPELKDLFGLGGIIGFIYNIYDYDYYYGQETYIYKFNIKDDGSIKYDCKTNTKGTTINQFSLDEYKGNLRVGLYTYDGSRVAVFDKNLKLIGETEYLSKGERMYSTRFMGDKAYMVTYKNTDPLYVIDLSNPNNPTVLGKLKIPGYSTYLHPYDETHLIGIGMQTEEKVYRDSSGKVTSTTAVITGMKMAIFDVSDVNNPKQISQTLIGDSRATSAILTNHKALLFSKEKGIIAIPVNNYAENVEISASTTDISSMVNSYKNYGKRYISEGYFVYNIDLTDGFKLKGTITHDKKVNTNYYYTYRNTNKLLRGLWIENNLFTVSEDMMKVNNLNTLEEKATLQISKNDTVAIKDLQYLN